jgi:hypothetical protein
MYFLVEYQVIDIESHNLHCWRATEEQMNQAIEEATAKGWQTISAAICDIECDMQKLCGDGPGILVIVKMAKRQ